MFASSGKQDESFIDTLISHGLYFQVAGGGELPFSHDSKGDKSLTNLKYNFGLTFENMDLELGYRHFAVRDTLDIGGVDVFTKHTWPLWSSGGFYAGAGGYVYQTEMDKTGKKPAWEKSAFSPYIAVGGYYELSEYIDVSLQLDSFFNVAGGDWKHRTDDKKTLNQVSLSLTLRPWDRTSFPAQPITQALLEPQEKAINLAELSPLYRYDEATLNNEMKALLKSLIVKINQLEHYEVVITGGADSKPRYMAHNIKLAETRAKIVADFLILHGIKARAIRLETAIVTTREEQADTIDARKVEITVNGTERVSP
ncbi:OmpA family protein [Vibrio sagamiensis]|uniref:OmpA-like domain-containing protein n=1 Tax=Vibrio sagamiensis NBRC 104589 TaxID=1219064 RepID=A0A511QIE3_9VIBR|nr:OmpA family protein [Vibrio sagamiensis]PNQ54241.1 cell envelope biogenesis protein OmpA [Vibrio agarivorans]GEM76232.1 hypothetical protein VSA01S_23440 [Vibrio sagamiensis NBRC 104589]